MVRVHQDSFLKRGNRPQGESQPEKKSLLGKCEYSNGFSGSGTHTHAITHKSSAFHVFIIKVVLIPREALWSAVICHRFRLSNRVNRNPVQWRSERRQVARTPQRFARIGYVYFRLRSIYRLGNADL